MSHKYPNLREFVKDNVLDDTLAAFDPLVDKITRNLFRDLQHVYAEWDGESTRDKWDGESTRGKHNKIQNLLTMLVFLPPGFPSTDKVAQLCEDWADDEIEACEQAYKDDLEKDTESEEDEEAEETKDNSE
jgi:hypothetical protein